MRTLTCLLPKVLLLAGFGLALMVAQAPSTFAQEGGVVPASYESGSFFNQKLGTALRFNYHTRGYGTQDDVFSLGGMKVFNMDGAAVFVDGQGTLSDDFGGGYNLGVGYRQLTNTGMSFDPERILGIGFWTDGQSTASDNFFAQLGFTLESLGDSFDMRLNGSFPLERTQTSDAIQTGTGSPFFLGNNIFGATEEVTIDTAHSVLDGELAKRINDLEAWAFIGGYQLGGGGVDTTGYRAGVRGYAVPDLALSLQVTDDDVYATNVIFGITWFIGRTNKCNGPCGTILDRFREPVLRNDFIATTSRRESRASGSALTEQGTTDAIRVVHIDDDAGAGGDGSVENPFDQISDIDALNVANSLEGDILLVHSDSNFVGVDGVATLQANQRLLGEGTDTDGNEIPHIIATNELGNISLPETAAGSLALGRPTVDAGGLDVFTLADGSSVNNFTINNAGTAVTASGIAAPTGSMLANLQINGVVNGVLLENTTGTVVVENTVEINAATGIGIEVNGGADGMSIAASINDSTGRSLSIHDRTGGTIDYTGTIDDDTDNSGADFSDGVLITTNANAAVNMTNALDIRVDDGETAILITDNTSTDAATPATVNASGAVDITATGTGSGLVISGSDATASITFGDLNATAVDGDTVNVAGEGTVSISSADDTRTIENTGTGNAFVNDGAAGSAVITVNSNVENTVGGNAVRITNRAEANDVQFAGTVNAAGTAGVFAQNNTDGTVQFSNTLTLDTATNNAVELLNNTGATLSFSDLDIDTTDGDGFVATGGGTLLVTSTNGTNDINVTGTGVGLDLTGMTIDPGNATFNVVGVGNGAGVGINLQNLDGTGLVTIGSGTNPGDGGTLTTAGTAININNANNVVMSNLSVSNAGAAQGINVTGQLAGSSVAVVGLDVNTVDADAVNISGNTDGTILFTDLTGNSSGTGGAVVINNNAAATVNVNGMTATATGTGTGFRATGTGNLSVTGTTSVSTNTGKVLEIDGQNIEAGGARFDTVNATGTVAGTAVDLKDITGGQVTVGSGASAGDGGTLATTGTAITVDNVASLNVNNVTVNNTTAAGLNVTNQVAGSTATFNRLTVDTTTADAVTVSSNTAGTVTLTNLDAQATTGRGVVVENNGTATTNLNSMTVETTDGTGLFVSGTGNVNANGTNSVTTTNGVGVDVVDAQNASINSVTVTTTGSNAVSVTHTAATTSDVSFSNLTVAGAGDRGVNVLANGIGEFDLTLSGATIGSVGDEGIFFDTGASAGRVDFTLSNSTITVGDQNALLATLDDSDTADVRFAIDNNTFNNASGTADADLAAVDISVGSGLTAHLRVGSLFAGQEPPAGTIGDNNIFTNSSADGDPLRISINDGGAGGVLNLDLRDNTAQGGTVEFELTQTSGTFNLVDSVDTLTPNNANNVGTVTGAGAINTIAPPILAPTP